MIDGIRNDFPLRLDYPRAWRTYTGGALIDTLHGEKEGKVSNFPEEWIMSVVSARNAGREEVKEEGMSHLLEYGNITLKELIEGAPSFFLGERHAQKYGAQLGVLVKLIDSGERLTVQVHPDREQALKLFGSSYGKTESWHILGTRMAEGQPACIYIGFKPGITRERWKELFDRQDIPGMLSWLHRIEVHKGDTILIKGGVPHAIGAGCFLAEIQEPTDYTIRVEKVTPAGLAVADEMCHQGLGFDKMFDCFHYEGVTEEEAVRRWFIRPRTAENQDGGRVSTVLGYDDTPLFCLEKIEVEFAVDIKGGDIFSGIYVLDGSGVIYANGRERKVKQAEQYFIPAGTGDWRVEAGKGETMTILRFMGPRV